MKSIAIIAGLLIVLVNYANSQTRALHSQSSMDRSITDKEILSKLNAKFIQNFVTEDTVSHNQIIHKDFVCIAGNGAIVGRKQYMDEWATGYRSVGYKTFDFTEEFIRIFGNVALVRSKTVYTKEVDGKDVIGHSLHTDTYIKDDGTWLCIQAQITPIKQ